VLKVIWGGEWDKLLEKDTTGLLKKRMEEVVDGEYQAYKAKDGAYVRQHFFALDFNKALKVSNSGACKFSNSNERTGNEPPSFWR
jgi:pyruvate dehydrogenase complex dehydrogenase (E1) component